MKIPIQITIYFIFIVSSLQSPCTQIQLASKDKCKSSEVSDGYYKCCFYKGSIDKVSTGEKIVNFLGGTNREEYESIIKCVEITKNEYNDINKYIKNHQSLTFDNTTVKFDSVSVDCFCNYEKVKFWVLGILVLVII